MFYKLVKFTFHAEIESFYSDNGGEYISKKFVTFLFENKIKQEFATPGVPEENGIAERFNRTLWEKTQVMILSSKLPHKFWPFCVETATYLYNRSPHSYLQEKTPFEMVFCKKPNLEHLKVFGCLALYQSNEKIKKQSLAPRNEIGIFVGYSQKYPNSFLIYDVNAKETKTLRKVQFVEDKFLPDLEKEINSKLCSIKACEIPRNFKEAKKSNDFPEWQEAMQKEIQALEANAVFELVEKPFGKPIVKNRWVFSTKNDGKKKARLVAKGYSQVEGVDYFETFAPTLKNDSLRLLLALAAKENLLIHQMDVSTAFLNAKLEEEVYLEQPAGFYDSIYPDYVWKLKKAIYGLKQAPRAWNEMFSSFLISQASNNQKLTLVCFHGKQINLPTSIC